MARKYVDVRITALSDTDIKDILILLRKIQWCGEEGASRSIPIVVDGDGSGQFGFNLIKEGKEIKNLNEVVELDAEKLKKVSDGGDFETSYLGE